MHDIFHTIGRQGVIPVVTIEDAAQAVPVCQALRAGGVNVVEITLRSAAGAQAIATISQEIPDLIVGAGTVLTTDQAKQALDSTAKFVVTPGFNPRVVQLCLDKHMPIAPGCANATDMTLALEYGLEVVKFFPAEQIGGLKTLKALAAPFTRLQFIPTGGIGLANLGEYLAFPPVLACGGTWIAKQDAIRSGDYSLIENAARQSLSVVNELYAIDRVTKG